MKLACVCMRVCGEHVYNNDWKGLMPLPWVDLSLAVISLPHFAHQCNKGQQNNILMFIKIERSQEASRKLLLIFKGPALCYRNLTECEAEGLTVLVSP